jgi:GLPGLI family protein
MAFQQKQELMNRFIGICFLYLVPFLSYGQPKFISSGTINFERQLDLSKETQGRPWLGIYPATTQTSRFYTTSHILYFTPNETVFKRNPADLEKSAYYNSDRSADDMVYTSLANGIFSKKLAFYEETVFLTDSLRDLEWEMTNEVRTIAGFECRKATTIILDSVYVIAFYSDEILSNGGPLSYYNLPGMILGLVIPRMNLTFFATSVELTEPTKEQLAPPSSPQFINYENFEELIKKTATKFGSTVSNRIRLKSLL